MSDQRIAIIGMACRFPGAHNKDIFWKNLCEGHDSVVELSTEELRAAGVPEYILQDPHYVKCTGKLEGAANFDASFFGYTSVEAKMMDPQQRLFLEMGWAALEDAGYRPKQFKYPVGVFAGCAPNKYFLYHLFGRRPGELVDDYDWQIDDLPIGSNPDALVARLSYKLGLNGPSIAVQTACSSSLVAIAMACDSLLDYRCELALAGGIALQLPSQYGYLYQEQGMLSKSGRCKPFDGEADGSVFGSGGGIVVLKRLEDALQEKDSIYAVIRGWSVRNDGSNRAGYTAPGIEGQANVVAEAQIAANVEPEEICYIETHGSATPVGDPIEVAGLARAFSRSGKPLKASCAIGSVKSNIGHLDAAAGVAGFIKTALALKHRILPKTLHFKKANAAIDFENSPFYLQQETCDPWRESRSLIAAVSSFGLGGTNAHVILEAITETEKAVQPRLAAIIPTSAQTITALQNYTEQMQQHLEQAKINPWNASYTFAMARTHFPQRAALIVSPEGNLLKKIAAPKIGDKRGIAFLFPGLGEQFPGSFKELYEVEGVFRSEMQKIAAAFAKHLNFNLLDLLYPEQQTENSSEKSFDLLQLFGRKNATEEDRVLQKTTVAQPTCFALEYALAKQWMAWGIQASAFLGHSIGEFVAACLSGVLTFEDAIAMVAIRASAIEQLPGSEMLAVPLPPHEIEPLLNDLWIAAINADDLTVISGLAENLTNLQISLAEKGIICQKLRTTHAFHSELLREAAKPLVDYAKTAKISDPKIPYVSNLTGNWISEQDLASADYWGEHLCKTVLFASGFRTLCSRDEIGICLEVGPGQTLKNYARLITPRLSKKVTLFHSGASYFESGNCLPWMETLAMLWSAGIPIAWEAYLKPYALQRISLPTYPFESKSYWIERKIAADKPARHVLSSLDSKSRQDDSKVVETPIAEMIEIGESRPELSIPYVAPRNEVESKLATLWKGLFGYQAIGIHDDFVALGGHSLMALQFANKLWRLHRVELAIADLLTHSTIEQLALLLKDKFEQPKEKPQDKETKENNIQVTHAILNDYLLKQVSGILHRSLTVDEILSAQDILKSLPELIRAFKNDFDFKLYPNEMKGLQSISDFSSYLTRELLSHQSYYSKKTIATQDSRDSRSIVFILSTVRSGSTLLRVMLAGHPQLFCPPEFHVLAYETMQERESKDSASDKNQGIEIALKEIYGLNQTQAKERIETMLAENWETSKLISSLAADIAPRLFVDKSPGNANSLETLRRIQQNYPNAKYICLFRHPYSVIDSVVKNRFVKLMEGGAIHPYDFGEFVWSRSTGNILDFIETLAPHQVFQLRYETMVTETEQISKALCQFLEVPFSPTLLTPYEGRRMRDGLGDPNFLDHDAIETKLALAWKQVKMPRPISRHCRLLARALNYEVE